MPCIFILSFVVNTGCNDKDNMLLVVRLVMVFVVKFTIFS